MKCFLDLSNNDLSNNNSSRDNSPRRDLSRRRTRLLAAVALVAAIGWTISAVGELPTWIRNVEANSALQAVFFRIAGFDAPWWRVTSLRSEASARQAGDTRRTLPELRADGLSVERVRRHSVGVAVQCRAVRPACPSRSRLKPIISPFARTGGTPVLRYSRPFAQFV